jgi:cysteine desulfurase
LIYLDYNATAPVRPEVIKAVADSLGLVGNPSSVHAPGRHAKQRIEAARTQVAALAGARPRDIIFTSGGTEANNLALKGSGRQRLIVSATEHDSVLDVARDWPGGCEILAVDGNGVVNLAALEALLGEKAGDTLLSVMLANNETGVIQPISEIAALAHGRGALLHVDAVQALGKIPVDFKALGADLMTISAHKIGGPQGVGALILVPGLSLAPQISGGGQELRRRSGTENVSGIAGFGVAAELAADELSKAPQIAALRDQLEARLFAEIPDLMIAGAGSLRVGNTTSVVMPGVSAETQIMNFDLAGFCVSAGAACSSGKVRASHVLTAMGFDNDAARSAIRVSLGRGNSMADIERFVEVWLGLYRRTRREGIHPRPNAPALSL